LSRFEPLFAKLKIKKDSMKQKVSKWIRDKAYTNLKAEFEANSKDIEDLSSDELEGLLKEQEDAIVIDLQKKSILALLALFGINLFV